AVARKICTRRVRPIDVGWSIDFNRRLTRPCVARNSFRFRRVVKRCPKHWNSSASHMTTASNGNKPAAPVEGCSRSKPNELVKGDAMMMKGLFIKMIKQYYTFLVKNILNQTPRTSRPNRMPCNRDDPTDDKQNRD